MIKTAILGLFGKKAKFIVTPKENHRITLAQTAKITFDSVLFGIVITIICYWSCDSILPVLFIFISCALAPIAVLLANIKINQNTNEMKESVGVDIK